ncbi:MAG: hypothetical protein A2498_06935 [Lentisphaerae bacterium RIFOXYC12_FULL_60_16]|nr:MAG: hypothetical protein A2498_06935 [Lentisphaerae bacterium RIFOXYC12_FULL_60_16]OGV83639.1 MAG: hypothetical protein A2340_11530 [Lentisphaerae bacterium RIFOXYB12_FULL_60_10]
MGWVFVALLLAGPVGAGERDVFKTGPISESFTNFNGQVSTLPAGWTVSSDGVNVSDGSAGDFQGIHTGGARTGGCYAWQWVSGSVAVGCQPTADLFTPGYFQWALVNRTGLPVSEVAVSCRMVYRNDTPRSVGLNASVGVGTGTNIPVDGLSLVTPEPADLAAIWEIENRCVRIKLTPHWKPGETLRIRWTCDDLAGTGSRDEVGLDEVTIQVFPPAGTVFAIQ